MNIGITSNVGATFVFEVSKSGFGLAQMRIDHHLIVETMSFFNNPCQLAMSCCCFCPTNMKATCGKIKRFQLQPQSPNDQRYQSLINISSS